MDHEIYNFRGNATQKIWWRELSLRHSFVTIAYVAEVLGVGKIIQEEVESERA